MNDKRSFEIKKILAKHFPNFRFKVRIEKYSGGESINVYTNLLKKRVFSDAVWRVNANANYSEQDMQEYLKDKEKSAQNEQKEREIKELIGQHEKVDYDTQTGEVLQGGNTFLFIEAME